MPKFVIHEHVVDSESHWDLMLEQGDTLATWRVPVAPFEWAGEIVRCRKSFDHRDIYLTYQGEITGGRGEVRIVASGQYQPIDVKEDYWQVSLNGEIVNGVLKLKLIQNQQWELEFQGVIVK